MTSARGVLNSFEPTRCGSQLPVREREKRQGGKYTHRPMKEGLGEQKAVHKDHGQCARH